MVDLTGVFTAKLAECGRGGRTPEADSLAIYMTGEEGMQYGSGAIRSEAEAGAGNLTLGPVSPVGSDGGSLSVNQLIDN